MAWPSPSAEAFLARATRARYQSTLDCIWGFTQVGVTPETSDLLALTTRRGLLKPEVLYFGPKQGPGIFQMLMDATFGHLRGDQEEEFHCIFIDDVNIATEPLTDNETDDVSFERHVRHCELFLEAARQRQVQFKLTKCRWAQDTTLSLGFEVGRGARRCDPTKAEALRAWPDPSSVGDVVSFRAFANFVWEFIPCFHEADKHLRKYCKKGAKWSDYQRDKEAQKAFSQMREGLYKDAALYQFDYEAAADPASGRPLELYIDASDYAWGCCLAQRAVVGGPPRPGAVYGRSFTATEMGWHTFERELFAYKESLLATEHLTKGFPLLVLTDHKNNLFTSALIGNKRVNKKLLRWSLDIQEHSSRITRCWIAGKDNVLGDGPSRNPPDRDQARSLAIPAGPVRKIIMDMFCRPDALEKEVAEIEAFCDGLEDSETQQQGGATVRSSARQRRPGRGRLL